MTDLQTTVNELRSLGSRRPTPERRAAVARALSSKFEGVQSVAAQVLGEWGDRESIDALHAWLLSCLERPFGWAVRGVAVRALARTIGTEDIGWALDLYFGVAGVLQKHELLPLVLALPPETARDRLVAELRNAGWENRQAAAKAIGNMGYSDRMELLSALADDPQPQVRRSAKLLSEGC